MKRGQLAEVLVIVILVAAIGAFVVFSHKVGRAIEQPQPLINTFPVIHTESRTCSGMVSTSDCTTARTAAETALKETCLGFTNCEISDPASMPGACTVTYKCT